MQSYHHSQGSQLSKDRILNHLLTLDCQLPIELHLFASIDSTNRYLKSLPANKIIDVCCAETQTAGRGRFGRTWHSPYGEHIYFSSRWHFDCDPSHLSGLSLVVSLAIIAALTDFGIKEEIRVKWPNDLIWQHRKLSGTLIEVVGESHHHAEVIIGIGLNVNGYSQNTPLIDKPWCSLCDLTNQELDRNRLIALLIIQLHRYVQAFITYGFTQFIEQWQSVDYLYHQNISVRQGNSYLHGKACGVNELGYLVLEDDEGMQHDLSSGDTSLHQMR